MLPTQSAYWGGLECAACNSEAMRTLWICTKDNASKKVCCNMDQQAVTEMFFSHLCTHYKKVKQNCSITNGFQMTHEVWLLKIYITNRKVQRSTVRSFSALQSSAHHHLHVHVDKYMHVPLSHNFTSWSFKKLLNRIWRTRVALLLTVITVTCVLFGASNINTPCIAKHCILTALFPTRYTD
jgi:hypothetical protein